MQRLGNSITSIGNRAFLNCKSMPCVVLPDTVTEIGDSAFFDCENLSSVVIGRGVTAVGAFAFIGGSNLKTVYYKGTGEEWINIGGVENTPNTAHVCYYSETKPSDDGSFWYYDTYGEIAMW